MKGVKRLTTVVLAASSMLVMACGNDAQFSEIASEPLDANLTSIGDGDIAKPLSTSPMLNKRITNITLYEAYRAKRTIEPIPVHQVMPGEAVFPGKMGLIKIDLLSNSAANSTVISSKVDFFSYFGDCVGSQPVAIKQMDDLLNALSDSPSVKSIDSLLSDPNVEHYRYIEKATVDQGVGKTIYYVALANDKENQALNDAIDIIVKNQQALRDKNICPKPPKPVK